MLSFARFGCCLEHNKLGVFFWATGSYMEGTLPLEPWLGANLSILETD